MKNELRKHEHWITAGLIAVTIMLLSYAQLWAGTANYVYDSENRVTWVKDGTSGKNYTYDQVGNRENVTGSNPDAQASPSSHGFGAVLVNTTSSARTFTLTNVGLANLNIGTVAINGTDSSEFSTQNDNCSSQSVSPGNNCMVDVKFSPTVGGEKSANLTVPSNDSDSPLG